MWPMLTNVPALPFSLISEQQNPQHQSPYGLLCQVAISQLPNLWVTCFRLVNKFHGKPTGPICLKFISKVWCGMAMEWLVFDYCVAIGIAMVAISKLLATCVNKPVNRFQQHLTKSQHYLPHTYDVYTQNKTQLIIFRRYMGITVSSILWNVALTPERIVQHTI